MRRGVRVTLNTDNMTVSDTDLDKEYARLGITEEEKSLLLENAKKAAKGGFRRRRFALNSVNQNLIFAILFGII